MIHPLDADELSEIALALKHGRPVVSVGSWRRERPDGAAAELLHRATTATEAVDRALALAGAEAPTGVA